MIIFSNYSFSVIVKMLSADFEIYIYMYNMMRVEILHLNLYNTDHKNVKHEIVVIFKLFYRKMNGKYEI